MERPHDAGIADLHAADLESQLHAESVGELSLKGFNRPVLAYNVLGVLPGGTP